jgi:hypothetical protein
MSQPSFSLLGWWVGQGKRLRTDLGIKVAPPKENGARVATGYL